jgi:hypothetical protein
MHNIRWFFREFYDYDVKLSDCKMKFSIQVVLVVPGSTCTGLLRGTRGLSTEKLLILIAVNSSLSIKQTPKIKVQIVLLYKVVLQYLIAQVPIQVLEYSGVILEFSAPQYFLGTISTGYSLYRYTVRNGQQLILALVVWYYLYRYKP